MAKLDAAVSATTRRIVVDERRRLGMPDADDDTAEWLVASHKRFSKMSRAEQVAENARYAAMGLPGPFVYDDALYDFLQARLAEDEP